MKTFKNIEEVCAGLNEMAEKEKFFKQDPADIDDQANEFVARFASENNMESHTVSPSRWWFESGEHGMFEDGEIELYPLVKHAIEELHPGDRKKTIRFVAVNVDDAKLTKHLDED